MIKSVFKFNHFAKILRFLTIIYLAIYVLAASLVSLNRFWQYEVFYYDFGIFDQAIWRVSKFQAPIIEHLVVGGKWIFADHFSPGLLLLSPLYWLTNKPEIMLIAQAVVAGLSALVLLRIAKKLLNQPVLELAAVVSYTLFVGLQNALITDMHEVVFMLLPLMLTLEAIVLGKKRLVWVYLILTLAFKESAFLLGIGLGLFAWYVHRDWRKEALGIIAVAGVWGIVVINLIIPAFSQTEYAYKPVFYREPWKNIISLVDQPLKRQTQFLSLWSFGFLPILAPATWPLIGQDWIVRFMPQDSGGRWTLGMHYSAQLAPLLAIGLIYGLVLIKAKLTKFSWFKKSFRSSKLIYGDLVLVSLGGILILNALYLHQVKLHGPLGLAYNPAFYRHSSDFEFLDQLIARIPPDATVMTQNNLATRFTHRQMWLLRFEYKMFQPDYIVLDVRPDQNPNNYFPLLPINMERFLSQLKADPSYQLKFQSDYQLIFVSNTAK